LEGEGKFEFTRVEVSEVVDGALNNGGYTVLCLPGGFAKNYIAGLGEVGLRLPFANISIFLVDKSAHC
jgi:hypothetical protein